MLSAEAFRLAMFETLRPFAEVEKEKAVAGSGEFPTLARHLVYDSRPTAIQDIANSAESYVPTLALYTPSSRMDARGASSGMTDREATAHLEIVAELAVAMTDVDANGDPETYADAMAVGDPQARLVLGALTAQVRYLLDTSPLVRKVALHIRRIDEQTFAVAEIGMRWHRITMMIEALVRDDDFSVAGQLPEPVNRLFQALPDGSYAKTKLAALADYFNQTAPVPLASIHITTAGPVEFGPNFET